MENSINYIYIFPKSNFTCLLITIIIFKILISELFGKSCGGLRKCILVPKFKELCWQHRTAIPNQTSQIILTIFF